MENPALNQGIRVLLVAAAELAFTLMLPPSKRAVFGYISMTTAIVGVANLLGWTRLFFKRANGRVPMAMMVLFWPWHSFVWVVYLLRRTFFFESIYDEVRPGWYLGAWPWSPQTWDRWPAVVDLTPEFPSRAPEGTPYLSLPTWDGTAPTLDALRAGVDFALHHQALGRKVLFHCAAGHSRSATVMAAALVEAGHAPTWQEAIAQIKVKRPKAHLNRAQEALLTRWTQEREGARP